MVRGLNAGDQVVVEGKDKVRPGDAVRAVPASAPNAVQPGQPAGQRMRRRASMSKFFLARPVFAWVIAIGIMVLGGLAIHMLPISQYPPIAPPSISITAAYPGASAETVENTVTQIIEQKMTGFDNLLYLSATSDSSGSARVELTFTPGTNPTWPGRKCRTSCSLPPPACPKWCSESASR